jgi:hypothetical protein
MIAPCGKFAAGASPLTMHITIALPLTTDAL